MVTPQERPARGEPMAADPIVVVYNPEPTPAQLTEDRPTLDPIKAKRAADLKTTLQRQH